MKISVFFDLYEPLHEKKDIGQISLGLIENGIDSGIITLAKKELNKYKPTFSVTQHSLEEFFDKKFWLENDSDAIISYTLKGTNYSKLIENMKLGKKKVFIKFDSDGNIAYPLKRNYFRIPLAERLTFRNFVGDLWWSLPFESLKRRRHASVAAEIIRQVELSNGAIIESPEALANLNFFLTAWGRSDLIEKTHFIPNPVSPDYISYEIGKKENIVISYGRWDDYRQKNTRVMVETALRFLEKKPNYRFVIFGAGTEMIKSFLSEMSSEVKDRLEILGFVEFEEIKKMLATAKIFFLPSRWEGFSIASGEALCMGCSIVGTPLEASKYLSMQGFSGSMAATFDKDAILAALLQDTKKWDNNNYNPQKIVEFWRPKLDRRTVAKSIENLARNS